MKVEASNLGTPLDAFAADGSLADGGEPLRHAVAEALGIDLAALGAVELLRRSIDARKRGAARFVATVAAEVPDDAALQPAPGVHVRPYEPPAPLAVPAVDVLPRLRPVVVGMGPAGLFCALYLARAGLRPIVVERGAPVEARAVRVARFNAGFPLDLESNVQFGEGGAGTFSDGKLNTGIKSPHVRHVLEELVEAGAPKDILVDAQPHIGTDRLREVVRALREELLALGAELRFGTRLDGIGIAHGRVRFVELTRVASGSVEALGARCVVLACGHSARDTFALLQRLGVPLERKPFAVGVRIEHPQGLIDQAQFGTQAGHPALGPARYKLAVKTKAGRGAYTFCMCPGGTVVAAASEEGAVCVNGMSAHARDGANANSALLAEVRPDDLPGDDPLAGVAFQREMERGAFDAAVAAGGAPFSAPAQTVGAFLAREAGRPSALLTPTYPRGVAWCDLGDVLPGFVTATLAEALPLLDRRLRGFAHPEAVLTGVEVRSSSPVRILRDDAMQSPLARGVRSGLYPCGEGAGYAGGIMSSAVDGLRVGEAIVAELARS